MQHRTSRDTKGRANRTPSMARPLHGAALRAWRKHRDLSLADLADRARFGQAGRSWLSRAERGLIHTATAERIQALANALDIKLHVLREGQFPPPDDEGATAPPADSHEARRRTSAIERLRQDVASLRDEVRHMSAKIDEVLTSYAQVALRNPDSDHPLSGSSGYTPATREAPLIAAADPHAEWLAVVERIRSHVAEEMASRLVKPVETRQTYKQLHIRFGEHPVAVTLHFTNRFTHSMAQLEGSEGDRCLFMDGISECFVPMDAHKERGEWLVNEGRMKRSELDQLIEDRERRLHELEWQLSSDDARVRDLYTQRALDDLVAHGRYALDDRFSHYGARPLRRAHIAQTIAKLADFLNTHRHTYELRFVDEAEWPCFFMVKQGQSLLIEFWISPFERITLPSMSPPAMWQLATLWSNTRDASCVLCEVEIRDDRVIQLFHNHFMRQLWGEAPYKRNERLALIERLVQLANEVNRGVQRRGNAP